jgi:predicted Zn-dependent peptidase
MAVTSDLEQVSLGEANAWANDAATPRGAVLTVVGSVSPEQVFASVSTWLGGWHGRAAPQVTEAAKPTPQLITTVRPGASQSRIRLSCRVDASTPAQRAASEVLAQWLLQAQNDALREQLGVTTGFDSQFNVLRGGSAWVDLSALVDTKRLNEALRTFRATLAKLEGDPMITGLDRARWGAARTQAHLAADSPTLAAHLASRLARGYSLDELTAPAVSLSQVSAADVAATMASCAQTAVTSLVGDRSSLDSAVP